MQNKPIDTEFLSLKKLEDRQKLYGETITTLSVSTYYVEADSLIDNLARDFEKNRDIDVVGVLGENHKPVGIIVRRELFDILGKQFGRDLYKNKSVTSMSRSVQEFKYHKNIITVAAKLGQGQNATTVDYYLMVDDDKNFYGIFSNLAVLNNLSDQTQQDISLARKLQSNIVKENFRFEGNNFFFVAGCRMAKGVGGDYYSLKKIGDETYLASICDVSGKGVSAALLSSIMGGMLHIFDFNKGVIAFLSGLNQYITETFQMEKIVTGLFIEFNEVNGSIKVYDLGHSMGCSNFYIVRNGEFLLVKLENSGIALGILDTIEIKFDQYTLTPGDRLVIMSDGVTDQRNSSGTEYGMDMVKHFFLENQDKSIEDIHKMIYADILEYRGTQPQSDDITLAVLEYTPKS